MRADGLIMDLLAAEMTARIGKDPSGQYRELTAEVGTPYYARIDAPATPAQKAALEQLAPEAITEGPRTVRHRPAVGVGIPRQGAAAHGGDLNHLRSARPIGFVPQTRLLDRLLSVQDNAL